jgi:hypothetical protein
VRSTLPRIYIYTEPRPVIPYPKVFQPKANKSSGHNIYLQDHPAAMRVGQTQYRSIYMQPWAIMLTSVSGGPNTAYGTHDLKQSSTIGKQDIIITFRNHANNLKIHVQQTCEQFKNTLSSPKTVKRKRGLRRLTISSTANVG